MGVFKTSFFIALIGILLAGWWGGPAGITMALMLSVLEVGLSFDNAVLNAATLQKMSPKWQRRFLTWGIFIAVFLMRLVFPVLIVASFAHLPLGEVVRIALQSPADYARYLSSAHVSIASFGGLFLLMVLLDFLTETREHQWLPPEQGAAMLGRIKGISTLLAMATLIGIQQFVPAHEQSQSLIAGMVGIMVFLGIKGLCSLLEGGAELSKGIQQAGFMSFLYLEVLDASFSLDGVIGAFALTQDIVLIMIGLGIGAIFVRSITVFLTRKETLQRYVFLEHGAHYAIGVLACIMLLNIRFHVPEAATASLGAVVLAASLVSSIRFNRKLSPAPLD